MGETGGFQTILRIQSGRHQKEAIVVGQGIRGGVEGHSGTPSREICGTAPSPTRRQSTRVAIESRIMNQKLANLINFCSKSKKKIRGPTS